MVLEYWPATKSGSDADKGELKEHQQQDLAQMQQLQEQQQQSANGKTDNISHMKTGSIISKVIGSSFLIKTGAGISVIPSSTKSAKFYYSHQTT